MNLSCPKCSQPIAAGNINVAQDIAFCAACGEVHKVSVLVNQQPVETVVTAPPPVPFCSNCGTKLDEGDNFCDNCGAKVEGNTAQVQTPQMAPQYAMQQQINAPPDPAALFVNRAWQYFCCAMKKYAVFQGRARRAEYWYYTIIYAIFYTVCLILDSAAGLFIVAYGNEGVGVLSSLFTLALLLPSWSVMVRRFHDIDRSAWWVLIPIYGFVLLFYTGTVGPNRFGADPKQVN
jgi:uncharacterized membrane protein YhaH (DUF805 family)